MKCLFINGLYYLNDHKVVVN